MKVTAVHVLCVCASLAPLLPCVALAQAFSLRHPVSPAALVWSDEFNGPARSQPNPANWTYDIGNNGWGNQELETYCAWASNAAPCNATTPNAYIGGDGYLHIVARDLGKGVYTSARLKTQGLQSFKYGRIEARIKIPEGQGIWPAFWMLGDNITTVDWPACGEIDIMENIGKEPSIYHGSLHMIGSDLTQKYTLPSGEKLASAFHIYGMTWTPENNPVLHRHAEPVSTPPSHPQTFLRPLIGPSMAASFSSSSMSPSAETGPATPTPPSPSPRRCSSTTSASMISHKDQLARTRTTS